MFWPALIGKGMLDYVNILAVHMLRRSVNNTKMGAKVVRKIPVLSVIMGNLFV
jgi:hypothetical protein